MNDPLVHVPGVGPVKRNYLIAGGVVALLIGIYVYRQRQSAASSSTDATSTTPAATDPATGYPTGSPEDLAALQAQQAASSAYDASAGSSGGGGTGGGLSTPPTSTGYASNGAWAQAAQSYLVTNSGGDPATVSAAIGAYIAGHAVSDAQKSIVEQSIAFAGYPPISASDGYPPAIRQQAPVVVPPTKLPLLKPPAHLRAQSATKNSVLMTWDGVPTARYYLYANGHKSTLLSGTSWEVNQAHTGIALRSKTAYSIQVSSVNTAGHEGAKSAPVTVHTK